MIGIEGVILGIKETVGVKRAVDIEGAIDIKETLGIEVSADEENLVIICYKYYY